MSMAIKTLVTHELDALGISYNIRPHSAPAFTAEQAARERGVRLSQIAKAMVVKVGDGLVLAVVPGNRRLSLRRLARSLGHKSARLADPDEARAATGFEIGSISPIGATARGLEVWVERALIDEEYVDISAGRPDAGVELLSKDLLRAVNGRLADISEPLS